MKTIYILFLFLSVILIISCANQFSQNSQEKKEIAELIKDYNAKVAFFVTDPSDNSLDSAISCYSEETDAILQVYKKEQYFLQKKLQRIATVQISTAIETINPMPGISFKKIVVMGKGAIKRGVSYTEEDCFGEKTYHKYSISKQGEAPWRITNEERQKTPFADPEPQAQGGGPIR